MRKITDKLIKNNQMHATKAATSLYMTSYKFSFYLSLANVFAYEAICNSVKICYIPPIYRVTSLMDDLLGVYCPRSAVFI